MFHIKKLVILSSVSKKLKLYVIVKIYRLLKRLSKRFHILNVIDIFNVNDRCIYCELW